MPLELFHIFSYMLIKEILPHMIQLGSGWLNMLSGTWRQTELTRDDDVIMGAMASQITSLTIVYSTVYSGADQRKHQSSASLAFVRGIHRGPVNSPHKWPVMRKMFPFDEIIMITRRLAFVQTAKMDCWHVQIGPNDEPSETWRTREKNS